MVREKPIDYRDSRFISIDGDVYIRQIKQSLWSSWKVVVYPGTQSPILFSKDEVKNFWHGRTFETEYVSDLSNVDKWDKYDLL